jgi:hypothetical protein
VTFLAGVPGETRTRRRAVYAAARALRSLDPALDTRVRLYDPYPGCPLAPGLEDQGLAAPKGVEEWAAATADDRLRPWIPVDALRAITRWNFYLPRAFAPRPRGAGRRLLRRLAQARVWLGFFGLDVERRLVVAWRGLRASLERRPPPAD